MRQETWKPLYGQQKLFQSAGTLSPRGRSGQSEERDIWEFSSSGWMREVVEEGERRLGGGPGGMEGGGLPWGEAAHIVLMAYFAFSNKLAEMFPACSYKNIYL